MAKRIFIIGGGRFGVHLALRLSELGCEVQLGDNRPQRVKELAEDGFHAVEMDATDDDALKESGALDADAVVVAIGDNMQASILASLLLKQGGARTVIGRALDVKHAQVLERLGVDEVVLPSRDVAYQLAEKLRDGASGDRHLLAEDYVLADVRLGPALAGQTLATAQLPRRFGVTAVLFRRPAGDRWEISPAGPALELAAGGVLAVVGRREKVNRFERDCGAT
ncbi:MAG: TrkA family potassium uptake protein [Verrucomicrobia bacterium]|nr:TrkA family potassium uptake protein [Verrucomicrobiota bacterium]